MYHLGRVDPGAPTDAIDKLSPELQSQLEQTLTECNYTIVPNPILWERYDGEHEDLRQAEYSWFTRYFDHH